MYRALPIWDLTFFDLDDIFAEDEKSRNKFFVCLNYSICRRQMSSYIFYASISTAGVMALASFYWIFKQRRNTQYVLNRNHSARPVVSHIIFYPIKGCKGIERYSVEVTENGIVHDREYAIVEVDAADPKSCKAMSQAKIPKLSLIVPKSITNDSITVSSPGMSDLIHNAVLKGSKYSIDFFGDQIEAIDQGDQAAEWFSSFLGKKGLRFVKLSAGVSRKDASGKIKQNSLFYATPILLVSKESLEEVSRKVGGVKVSHDRFRPNLVISGVKTPYLEDSMEEVNIGSLRLIGSQICERCSIPGVDQTRGELDIALLGKLRTIRSGKNLHNINPKYKLNVKDNEYYLGVYFEPPSSAGSIRIFVGQELDI